MGYFQKKKQAGCMAATVAAKEWLAKGASFAFLLTAALCCGVIGHAQTASVKLKTLSGQLIQSYGSIADAYNAIVELDKDYLVELTPSYTGANETFPITLGAKTQPGGIQHTITIRPAADVTNMEIVDTSANPVFYFYGAYYVIIDGRPGGLGNQSVLTLSNTNTYTTDATGLLFGRTIYQTMYDTVRYCNIRSGMNTPGSNIVFDVCDAYSCIEHCQIRGGSYGIYNTDSWYWMEFGLYGTLGNTTYACDIDSFSTAGIFYQYYHTGVIDSCVIRNRGMSSAYTGIHVTTSYGMQTGMSADSLNISQNTILLWGNSGGFPQGIEIDPGCNNSFIANNFISVISDNANFNGGYGIFVYGDGQTYIYNNSILFDGVPMSTNSSSSCINIAGPLTTPPRYPLYIQDNILENKFTGGQHVCLSQNDASDTAIQYLNDNTYYSATGNLVSLNGGMTNYTNAMFASWQAANNAIGNEANANVNMVSFVSDTNLHLAQASAGAPFLTGAPITEVPYDIDNDTRSATAPYRGADEAPVSFQSCQGGGAGTVVATDTTICVGTDVFLQLAGANSGNGTTYQWQSATDGVTYNNIPGATTYYYDQTPAGTTWYRCQSDCNGGTTFTSAPVRIQVSGNPPAVSNILVQDDNGAYAFSTNVTAPDYYWDFGDGSTSTAQAPTHAYDSSNSYTVTLIVSNGCGLNAATTVVNATGLETTNINAETDDVLVFPNPARDYVHIKNRSGRPIDRIDLLDESGASLYTARNAAGISVENVSAGIYLLRIYTGDNIVVTKLTVLK